MNKMILFLVCALALASSCLAGQPRVMIMKLNYDRGNLTLLNSTVKYGFGPDRRYEADYGHRAEILSFDDEVLYEFRFRVPNELFVDGTDENGELSGGKIVLDNVNFALNVPYYKEMKEISIYSPEEERVAVLRFDEERRLRVIKWSIVGLISLVAIILLAFIFIRYRRNQ